MEILSQIAKEARVYAISEINKYQTPHLKLFEISEQKAIELCDRIGGNLQIILIGVYLMDIKLGEAKSKNIISEHISMSVEAGKSFLTKYSLPQNIENNIINCISQHHGAKNFETIESEICANADCYRFLHPGGVLTYINDLGKSIPISDVLQKARSKLNEKWNILSIDICKMELKEYYETFIKYFDLAEEITAKK